MRDVAHAVGKAAPKQVLPLRQSFPLPSCHQTSSRGHGPQTTYKQHDATPPLNQGMCDPSQRNARRAYPMNKKHLVAILRPELVDPYRAILPTVLVGKQTSMTPFPSMLGIKADFPPPKKRNGERKTIPASQRPSLPERHPANTPARSAPPSTPSAAPSSADSAERSASSATASPWPRLSGRRWRRRPW